MQHDIVLIVDFGSQVTQLIARRVREAGVYCEIHPFSRAAEAFARLKPKAVIFSGGPASVPEPGSPRAPRRYSRAARRFSPSATASRRSASSSAARSRAGHAAEFGRADVEIVEACALFEGVWAKGQRYPVWMSHGDRVTRLPDGFRVYAVSENAPYAVAADETRRYYTTMFHPEVVHTPDGAKLIANFLHKIAGLRGDWTMAAFRAEEIARIRAQVGEGAGDLRPLRRRRFGGRGGADPRGDRRPAHLRLRRSRPHARRARRKRSSACFAATTTSRSSMSTRRTNSWAGSPGSTTPKRSARRSANCSSTRSRPRRAASRATARGRSSFSPKGRSIPT